MVPAEPVEDTSGLGGRGLMSSFGWEVAAELSMVLGTSLVVPPAVEQYHLYGSGTEAARAVLGTCFGRLDQGAQAPVEPAPQRDSERVISKDSDFVVYPSTGMKGVEAAAEHRAYRRGCCSPG